MIVALLGVLIAMTLVMIAGWAYQRRAGNGGWTDVFWTYGTGVSCAAAALLRTGAPEAWWRQAVVAGLVLIWSLRLGTYVALRVAGSPEDARYADLRRSWGAAFQRRMFGLLVVQAPITALLNVGVQLAAHRPGPVLRVWDALGLAILAGSILGETVADRQMRAFKRRPDSAGRVCRAGLWGWSRHPNYFFEFLAWVAYPVIACDSANPWSYLSILSPISMYAVIRYGTGIPYLEAAMLRAKGDRYRAYQREVSMLLLLPPRVSPRG